MLDANGCMAFSNTFQDLYGMEQLPVSVSAHASFRLSAAFAEDAAGPRGTVFPSKHYPAA